MPALSIPVLFGLGELAPLFGIVADLYGRRLLLAWGLLLFGLSGTAIAFAPTFGWVLTLRAVQGIGFSAVIPLTIVLIGDLLEGDSEVSGQGLKVFLEKFIGLALAETFFEAHSAQDHKKNTEDQ
ncbi:MAG: MFS transporter [Deltaproteobacteria bacterium]|nr:MFS transporter [Deltaproteobacteria bacterium]